MRCPPRHRRAPPRRGCRCVTSWVAKPCDSSYPRQSSHPPGSRTDDPFARHHRLSVDASQHASPRQQVRPAAMKPRIVFESHTIEPDAFFDRVMRAASALQSLGVTDADTVALMLRNTPHAVELMMALRWLGATWCPINWHFKGDELHYLLIDSGPRLFIAEAALLRELHAAVPPGLPALQVGADPSTDAPWPRWETLRDAAPPCTAAAKTPRSPMLYTSGTTGRPKGIRRRLPNPVQVARTLERSRLCYGYEPGMRA